MSTVVVVDDHRTFADLLQIGLSTEPGLRCVGAAYDIASGLELVHRLQPDLVVMDVQFGEPDRDGVSATALITSAHPATRVVLLTGHADPLLLKRASDAGACSLMPKDGSLTDLLSALHHARNGGLLVHARLLKSLISGHHEHLPQAALSPREHDVLAMAAVGLDVRTTAQQLGISPSTCRGYVKTMLRKLGAHSQLEAVAIARRQGLLRTDDQA